MQIFQPANNGINILSPTITANPTLHYNYQNSTVNLTISVTYVKEGLTEPPKVSFISYSLDGQPLVYLRNLTTTNYYTLSTTKTSQTIRAYNYFREPI